MCGDTGAVHQAVTALVDGGYLAGRDHHVTELMGLGEQ